MLKQLKIVIGIISFLLGVSVGSFFIYENLFAYVASFFVFISLVFVLCFSEYKKFLLIFAGCFLIGFVREIITIPIFDQSNIAFYSSINKNIQIEGQVNSEPDIRSDKIYFVLKTEFLIVDNRKIAVQGNVLVKLGKYPEIHYTDKLVLQGKLLTPARTEDFDYQSYLGKDNIFVVMYSPQIKKITYAVFSDNPLEFLFQKFFTLIIAFKILLTYQINQIFIEPAASLNAGLLLGLRKTIDQNLLDNFSKIGLTHILAVSGYNITLVINIFSLVLKNFSRGAKFWLTTLFLVFFCIVTGLSASVIRAGFMGFFILLGAKVGRKSYPFFNLMISIFLMVFLNPRILNYDVSFQLSFFATLGLFIFVPIFTSLFNQLAEKLKNKPAQKYLKRLPDFLGNTLIVTLAAQVLTLPIIAAYFHNLPLISPLANIIVLPFIPWIMLLAFLAIIVSFLFWPLAIVIGTFAWILIIFKIFIVNLMVSLPFSSIKIENFSVLMTIIYYSIVLFFSFKIYRKKLLG